MKQANENNNRHYYVTESEANPELKWTISPQDLLLDIKCLMKDYYTATFQSDGNSLKISFNNGQSFAITVSTID